MTVAVMGAGAVGCFFGGMLARAGHDVVLIGRPAHVDAIRAHGLRMDTRMFDEQVRLRADTEASAAQGADVVLFCVKSTDTVAAARELEPFLGPDTLLLSLQNGVDNAERLREVLRQPVSAAVVYVATEMAGPGHVKHHGRGELVIEPAPGAERVAQAFVASGVAVEISDNVRGALWSKLLINCAYNALSALSDQPYGELVKGEGVWTVMDQLLDEGHAVAEADGVRLVGDVREAVRKIAVTMPGQFSSTAQDLRRGKPTEIDHLNGFLVRRGEALGIPVPANRVLHTLVRLAELGNEEAA
ncbi:ketopantoate reductase family protein [Roseateles chitosanitabidus]|uniref:ketopantoate reductase family protein n=1 Tax=Roseateles chitosanitabidus TaxID=65048 RepID=UPI00082EB785|nr:2-dehydropantoate 2-reductase [Roseateles chitosanitabidus]MBO9688761.1 2-dehydropantoate 2-reductase [Roseateles chitosanitabidus]